MLSQHFANLIQSHADLKIKERNHEEICSCNIQIDLSPKVLPLLQEVYQRLYMSDPAKHFRVTIIKPKMLAAFEYLFGITEQSEEIFL